LKDYYQFISLVIGSLLLLMLVINFWIVISTSDQIYDDVSLISHQKVGLVLGTSRYASKGVKNEFFEERIDAASRLFKIGKISHILVSGDNRSVYYNEPRDMLNALKERGIPEEVITLDYAGLRTLDSVVRCHQVFGQSQFIIVSQQFHLYRALFIANHYGLKATGYLSSESGSKFTFKISLREFIARPLALFDLYIWNRQPKFSQDYAPIG
jgi:SanA protein